MIARCDNPKLFRGKLIVDLFAGAGGASTGIEEAFMAAGIERHVDLAINHDPDAIACHELNHPWTDHLRADVFEVDPESITGPIGLLWASPDCTDFSKAKGGKPIRTTKRRSLAWVVVHWAFIKRPDVIMLENVEEFQQWGLLDDDGQPIRDGRCFEAWVSSLRALGYQVEWRELRACDYGTPTTRKRLFVVARCDGLPIVWPTPTHGASNARSGSNYCRNQGSTSTANRGIVDRSISERIGYDQRAFVGRRRHHQESHRGGDSDAARKRIGPASLRTSLKPYLAAADCIDFTVPMLSIFATPEEAKAWGKAHGIPTPRRPLAENTLKRIARGVVRYVIEAAEPFIVPVQHYGRENPCHPVTEPLRTVTAHPKGGAFAVADAVVAPLTVGAGGPAYSGKPKRVDEPLGTVMVEDRRALVSAFLATNTTGHSGAALYEPVPTVTSGNQHALTVAHLSAMAPIDRGDGFGCVHGDTSVSPDQSRDRGGQVKAAKAKTQALPFTKPSRWEEPVTSGDVAKNRMADGALTAAHLVKLKGTCRDGQPVDDPLATVQAGGNHAALVAAFIQAYYGNPDDTGQSPANPLRTVPTVERFGLVTVTIGGHPYIITDIAMRMLTPRELARAQGFRDDYVIDRAADGRTLSKRTQVRLIGNSVCRHVSRALVTSNVIEVCDWAMKRAS